MLTLGFEYSQKIKMKPQLNRVDPVSNSDWRMRLHEIIFEADTKAGKRFDILLLIAIVLSVLVVMLESIVSIQEEYGDALMTIEWIFTVLFSIEYIARLMSVKKPLRYAFSFFGIIDLLSILPTYVALFYMGTHSIRIIRILRLMRVFRVLKLIGFLKEAKILRDSMKASWPKITVFLLAVFSLVVVLGTMMYIIEDPEAGFTSIPMSIYWAIVTLTTVGYGDIAPMTPLGQALASVIMIMGYAIIAVPTGLVAADITKASNIHLNTQTCPYCMKEGHLDDSVYCRICGQVLND